MKHTKLLTLAIAALFAGSAMAETIETGTYSKRTLDGATSTWDFTFNKGGANDLKPTTSAENGVYFNPSSKDKIKVSKSGYLSCSGVSTIGFEVPSSTAAGTISMTAASSSDGRYFQLYINDVEGTINQRLWSKPGDDLSTKGPQSYTFTASDLTLIDSKYYLVFKDNNTEMKPATFTITLSNDSYEEIAANIATLSSISVDGEPIVDFDPETLTYSIELPFGTTDVPTVTATATSKKANAVVTNASALPGTTTITVTAEDGETTKTYTVNFTVAATASSEKELLNVKIGNRAVTFEGDAGTLLVSKSADLTQQVITFEVSDLATASIVSGSTQDFTNPLTITVTAQDLSTATYTITLTKATVDVLYLTTSSVEGDKLYNVIASKDYYIEARANGTNTDFSGYDLVVLHESLSGKDAADKELKAVATADVPVLNTKAYFYNDGRWGWGAPDNGNSQVGVKLNTKYTNIAAHPLFAGFTTDSITLYTEEAAKNIQPIKTFTAGKEGYALANVPAGVAIHELPASARLADGGTSKYLLISLLSSSWSNLSTEAETLLSNAVDYLLGTQAWAPQTDPTAIDATSTEATAVKRIIDGQLVIEKNGLRYNAQGITIE